MAIDTIRPWRSVHRRQTIPVAIGDVIVGGENPILVQACISDVSKMDEHISECVDIGADILSIPINTDTKILDSITQPHLAPIIAKLQNSTPTSILHAIQSPADAVQFTVNHINDMSPIVNEAKQKNIALIATFDTTDIDPSNLSSHSIIAQIESTLDVCKDLDFSNIIISIKADDIFVLYTTYMNLAFRCDCPIHLSLNAYGNMIQGSIRSAMTLGNLLWAGIGDIVHIELDALPMDEVKTAYSILKTLGLRHRGVNVISCPSCARQAFDVVNTVTVLEERLEHISTPLTLSVLGCIVNGIGEAQHTDIGFIGGGKNTHQVYMNGLPSHRLQDEDLIQHIVGLVEQKAQEIETQNLADSP